MNVEIGILLFPKSFAPEKRPCLKKKEVCKCRMVCLTIFAILVDNTFKILHRTAGMAGIICLERIHGRYNEDFD